MRVLALYILVVGLTLYAWKNWFRALCGLILMMAVIQHEDMPKSIMGIQGLNVWNVLFASILMAWFSQRRHEKLRWDLPRHLGFLLIIYAVIIVVGWLRAMFDRSNIQGYTVQSLVSEELINTLKWALPGLLLFDGCRNHSRLRLAFVSLLVMYLLLAVQVVRRMPWESALGGAGERIQRIRLKVCSAVGYSAVDMSAILAGASWAMVAAAPLLPKKRHKALVFAAAGLTGFAQALTGGRAGYLAWGGIGLTLCLLKWRKSLLLAPLVPVLLLLIFPGAAQRALTGIDTSNAAGQEVNDPYLMTSGRAQIWPFVIDKIGQSPFVGHGRMAMQRTGLTQKLGAQFGQAEAFPHPHNVYMEWLLDNGLLGFVPVILFFAIAVRTSARLFRDRNPWCMAVGGLSLSLILAQLYAGIGSQHFYPRESTLGMWAAMFLAFRVDLERQEVRAAALRRAQPAHAGDSWRQSPALS